MTDITTLLGITGAGLILLAFTLNQTKIWKNESISYDLVNLVGASLLVIYSWLLGSYPFLVLNLIWAGVSLRDVLTSKNKIGFIKK